MSSHGASPAWGGMPACDVVTLTVADDWLEFARPAGILEEDVLTPEGDSDGRGCAARAGCGKRSRDPACPCRGGGRCLGFDERPVHATASMRRWRHSRGYTPCSAARANASNGIWLPRHSAASTTPALLVALDAMPYGLGCSLDLPSIASTTGNELTVVYLVSDDVPGRLADFVDVAMQARHLVVLANPSPAPPTVGPVDVTVWPAGPLDDARLPSLAKDLLRAASTPTAPADER